MQVRLSQCVGEGLSWVMLSPRPPLENERNAKVTVIKLEHYGTAS